MKLLRLMTATVFVIALITSEHMGPLRSGTAGVLHAVASLFE